LHFEIVKRILSFYPMRIATRPTLVPQQARSRESLRRLLQAAAEVLEEKGLTGATIPRIATRAGLSPGAVYRRFRDKDALLRTLLLDMLQGADQRTAEMLTPEFVNQRSLPALVRKVVEGTLRGYRKHAGLMRALNQFARSHPRSSFRKRMDELEVRNFRRVVDALLAKRSEIAHPDPETAVPFALMLTAFALREIVVLGTLSSTWSSLMPKDDHHLADELTRSFLSYLRSINKT
jgi:AcrR family transcriptional regulator